MSAAVRRVAVRPAEADAARPERGGDQGEQQRRYRDAGRHREEGCLLAGDHAVFGAGENNSGC